MPETRFPLLSIDVSIGDAYGRMKEVSRSAVIIPQEDLFRIVTASELVTQQRRRRDPLAALKPLRMAASIRMLGQGHADIPASVLLEAGWPDPLRGRLASTGIEFAVGSLGAQDAALISPNTRLMELLAIAPSACYCTNPLFIHEHAHGMHGAKCNLCDFVIECW